MSSRASHTPSAPLRVVRLAQPFGLCPLFRPLPKTSGARPTLNVEYRYGADVNFRFSAREALGAPEQTLMLALLELAHEQHLRRPANHRLDETDSSEIGSLLWSSLHETSTGGSVNASQTLMLSCTWSELNRRCGASSVGGAVTESRKMSLARLCEVTVWEHVASTRTVRSCRLVSWMLGDDQRVHVALNHRLASALVSPGYAQLLMSERLALPSQTAMLVHAFLSTWLGIGKPPLRIGYDKLVERLWPSDGVAVATSTKKRRLSDVRAALRAIGRLKHWQIEHEPSVATVSRIALGVSAGHHANQVTGVQTGPKNSSPKESRDREMTSEGHFAMPDASFGERQFWEILNPIKHLPRNDEGRTIL